MDCVLRANILPQRKESMLMAGLPFFPLSNTFVFLFLILSTYYAKVFGKWIWRKAQPFMVTFSFSWGLNHYLSGSAAIVPLNVLVFIFKKKWFPDCPSRLFRKKSNLPFFFGCCSGVEFLILALCPLTPPWHSAGGRFIGICWRAVLWIISNLIYF